MNREIKFRAWDKENQAMIYDWDEESDFRFCNGKASVKYMSTKWREGGGEVYEDYTWEDVDSEVMQFTGLKDRNGKEIYEGDIVIAANGYKGKIEFGTWCYEDDYSKVEGIGFSWDGEEPLSSCHTGQSYEIIGNIYENPDLLK